MKDDENHDETTRITWCKICDLISYLALPQSFDNVSERKH